MLTQFLTEHSVGISAAILIISYIFIASEKIPKVTVAVLGAVVTILAGFVSQSKTFNGELNPEYFINFIDFNVIFLLVSMMIIVNIAVKSGIFTYCANELLKYTKGNPVAVLSALCIFTAVTSAFLDNVTTVILIMPITFSVAKKLDVNPIPYLTGEVFASNIGGTATLIGDPPNIIIGSAAGFSFNDFLLNLTLPIIIILAAVTFIMAIIFGKRLKTTPDKMREASQTDNSGTITDKGLMIRSLIVLSGVIAGFLTHDITHIETCIVATAGAGILLLFEKPSDIFKDVEWNTIIFFVGLFVIIGGFEASGGIKLMADFILKITDGSQSLASMLILWASGIISGVIDNIPYTATMCPMLVEISKSAGSEYTIPLWWCLSLGACLGGNMTIIGAAANVIVSENAAKHGYPISFLKFMKYGCLTVFVSLVISSIYVRIKYL